MFSTTLLLSSNLATSPVLNCLLTSVGLGLFQCVDGDGMVTSTPSGFHLFKKWTNGQFNLEVRNTLDRGVHV